MSIQRIRALREAGNVRRAHIIPHLGEYTVGKHSYDALTLLLVLHPDPSLDLVKAVLWHDAGERYLGDMPASAKVVSPHLKTAYELAELTQLERMGVPALNELTLGERNWLRAVDMLELWLWCLDQKALGNRNVVRCYENITRMLSEAADVTRKNPSTVPEGALPGPCFEFFYSYEWGRGTEEPW